jgi:hypothetical protein
MKYRTCLTTKEVINKCSTGHMVKSCLFWNKLSSYIPIGWSLLSKLRSANWSVSRSRLSDSRPIVSERWWRSEDNEARLDAAAGQHRSSPFTHTCLPIIQPLSGLFKSNQSLVFKMNCFLCGTLNHCLPNCPVCLVWPWVLEALPDGMDLLWPELCRQGMRTDHMEHTSSRPWLKATWARDLRCIWQEHQTWPALDTVTWRSPDRLND